MLFNSFGFLLFFPCVFLLYYALPFRFRKFLLLASSWYFYMCWKPEFIVLILFPLPWTTFAVWGSAGGGSGGGSFWPSAW